MTIKDMEEQLAELAKQRAILTTDTAFELNLKLTKEIREKLENAKKNNK